LVTVHFGPDEYENHLLHMRVMGMLMGNFDSHAYSYKDMAVAIFHRAEWAQDDFGAHLEKCATSLKRVVVVSSRFSDFSQLGSFYEQNTYVHEQLELQDNTDPRVVSCDAAFRRLLANCCKGSLPSCYGADVLYAYDQEHGTSYCETLLAYLVCERNAVATAQATFLHRNTLRNRLNKIDELINTDLENIDERMRLMIALNTLINSTV
jgi:DNA-binding PucR family transcriptional regulator